LQSGFLERGQGSGASSSNELMRKPERTLMNMRNQRRKLVLVIAGIAAFAMPVLLAQDKAAPAPRLKFAAASVRPAPRPGLGIRATYGQLKCLGVDGRLWAPKDVADSTPARRGRCLSPGVPLFDLVYAAYASSPTVDMVGFPFSPVPFFQIEAVADDPERVTKGELQQMLRALLEDRFKARVHSTTKEVDGYVLTIAKSGIKFKETSGEAGMVNGYPRLNGKFSMIEVARMLEFLLGPTSIADKTGLAGVYDMKFDVEEILNQVNGAGVRGEATPGRRQFSPPIPKALEDQLGLHLEPAKVPLQVIVVDHLELPTEN
jgi:uncharacterized protein (TIGR03435 family)